MKLEKMSFGLLPLLGLVLSSCGGRAPVALPIPDYTSINADWLMTGTTSNTLNFSQSPYIGAALAASGNSIYGNFKIELRCAEGFTLGLENPISARLAQTGPSR